MTTACTVLWIVNQWFFYLIFQEYFRDSRKAFRIYEKDLEMIKQSGGSIRKIDDRWEGDMKFEEDEIV